jgi:uncharacterized protein (DUF2141 family)
MSDMMRRGIPVAILMCVVSLLVGSAAMARQGADLTVTVSYSGKGPVNDKNDVHVFLFDHPEPTSNSRPLAMQMVTKNGGVATFKGVTAPTVYVVAVYDEKASYDGKSSPPPAGSPIATYSKAGKPVAVNPAKTPKVAFKFGDEKRWK